jgi:hypothetical protein
MDPPQRVASVIESQKIDNNAFLSCGRVAGAATAAGCAQSLQDGVATPQYLGKQDLLCPDVDVEVHGGQKTVAV